MRILLRILALAWRHPRHIVAAYVFLLGANGFALAVPWLLGTAIDDVLEGGSFRTMLTLAGIILLVNSARGAFSYGQTYLGEWVSQLAAYDLRNMLYAQLQRLSFAFHDTQQTGNLMSKATADVEAVRMFVQTGLLRAVQTFVMLTGAITILMFTNWRLGLVTVAVVPVVIVRSTLVNRALRRIWTHIQEITGVMTTVLQENLSGVRVVRAFGAQDFEREKFDGVIVDMAESSVSAARLQGSNTTVNMLLFGAATAAVLWFGGQEIVAGRLTPGGLAAFVFYLGMVQMPVRMSGFIINSFSRAASAGQRIFDVLDALSPVRDRHNAVDLGRAEGRVRFEDVGFSYGGEASVLQGISLEARPGQVIALLGAPGSGKTTLAHLVPRFYDVTDGRVSLDDIDVRDATLESLRRNVGIVMQDVFIFSATVRDNIGYGNLEATQGDIERAARTAQIHDFILTLPEGYDTWVGERGITLSGGQRQRLAIARTLLLDPPVLILDDTTSSVDASTEHLLRQALAEVMVGRTTFVIAHRLTTVLGADQILVMVEGEVAQRGTHEELVAQEGHYRQVYELQLLPEGAGVGPSDGARNGSAGDGAASRTTGADGRAAHGDR